MRTAVDNVKNVEVPERQWQGGPDHARAENDRLVKLNDALKQEAANIRSTLEQDAQRKLAEVRTEAAKLASAKAEFEAQRKEFEAALTAFKQEKTVMLREKEMATNAIANYRAMNEKVGAFIRLVKQEAEKL